MGNWKTVTPEQKKAMIDAGVWPSFVALRSELRARGVKDAAKRALKRYCPGFAAELAMAVNESDPEAASGNDSENPVCPPAIDGKDGPSCGAGGPLSARMIVRFTAMVAGRHASPGEWVTWIARNLEGKVEISDCPDVGALNYLIECRRNDGTRAEFWRLFMQKSVKMDPEGDNGRQDGAAVVDAVNVCLKAREKAVAACGKAQDGLQGGETASRLAHTQETVGSTPTPVTNSGRKAA